MLFDALLTILAPHECLACHSEGSLLCGACAAILPPVTPRCYRCAQQSATFATCLDCRVVSPLLRVWQVTCYTSVAKQLLHKLKFERAGAAADDIAHAMAQRYAISGALLTHVPTASSRVRQRGYDQAQLIAKRLAHFTGNTYASLLARSGQQRQLGQDRITRQTQLLEAFRVTNHRVKNQDIILVDDVITTGATFEAAAGVLVAAGARSVSAIAFAGA